jgi:hypothetical protein
MACRSSNQAEVRSNSAPGFLPGSDVCRLINRKKSVSCNSMLVGCSCRSWDRGNVMPKIYSKRANPRWKIHLNAPYPTLTWNHGRKQYWPFHDMVREYCEVRRLHENTRQGQVIESTFHKQRTIPARITIAQTIITLGMTIKQIARPSESPLE